MIDVALFEPEIPPNTGNIIRLCANTGAGLHLIHPLGFALDEKRLRRAGLDYDDLAQVTEHASFEAFLEQTSGRRLLSLSTRGQQRYDQVSFQPNDILLFGPETRGLPGDWLASQPIEQVLRLPMRGASRSLNLSNTVAIVVYESWRQLGFPGGQ